MPTNPPHTFNLTRASSDAIHHRARAKYIPQKDGSMKLVSVQHFTQPRFCEKGWETSDWERDALPIAPEEAPEDAPQVPAEPDQANIERASRRAKLNAFDTILCNHDLDTFATFTYRPDNELDKASYEGCYDILKPWLSNRVQRRGLKYVIVPERHKSGDIHFHGIMNSAALRMEQAISPKTGKFLTRNGLPIYNLTDWKAGFSTAQIIGTGEVDREKVAKYIFKYMGKQCGSRIGGRYALIGGANVVKPVYAYGDSIADFIDDQTHVYKREVQVTDTLVYTEVSFV